jgi:hypothetical protein
VNVLLATGGLNDVAMALGEAIDGGIFLVSSGLIAFSWWKRSFVGVVFACILLLALGALLQPWTFISPPPSNDPAEAFWLFRLRVISVIWTLLVVAAAACLLRVIRARTFTSNARNPA